MSKKSNQKPQLSMFAELNSALQEEIISQLTSESDATTMEQRSSSSEKLIAIPEIKVDPLACPKCRGKSLVSVRPLETGGTRYCVVCVTDGEPLYFTPRELTGNEQVAQAFDEVERVIAETPAIQEMNSVLEQVDAAVKVIETEELIEVSASKYDQEKLFAAPLVEATGKTIESLEYSRAMITEVMRKFNGELPQSIMRADKKNRGSADLATGSYQATSKHEGAFESSGRGVRAGALSAFPQNIGRACILLYTEEGDTVFDPFAGHNSRMEFCVKLKRNYIGCDISHKFMEFNRSQAEKLRQEYPDVHIELHEIDSRKCDQIELAEKADFTITSPPYWDIEDYGDEYQQLGRCSENYFEFMRNMQRVATCNYKQLKQGSFCVWFINDFRKDGVFYPYHIDTFKILREAGFVAWDMMITDFGGSFGQCFPAQVVDRKILPKRHEYGVVMSKL